jgi:NAD(P)-dependent dehydrogenase (short-subunit alcohol dehydrogenase family)
MVDLSSNPITIYQILILVPAALSFLYSISVQCFLAGWHECPWTFHISSISLRLTIFVVATAIFVASKEIKTTSTFNSLQLHAFLVPSVIFPVASIILIVRTRKIYITGPKPSLDNTARNKVIMITGANTGIGKETAKQLLTAGATVIMACRSESRAREAMKDILSALAGTDSGETTTLLSPRKRLLFLQCDVSDYNSVRQAVASFENLKLPLDVLVNNAGIMMGTRKENTANHELTMACNHLGHFLLTNLLLGELQKSNDARVIVVTSSTYVLANKGIDLEDLNCEKRKYTMFSQYAQSKLANILMGKELAKRELERVENIN